MSREYPTHRFDHKQAWAAWLKRNHAKSPGLWLELAKKGSKLPTLNYREALDVALCYGWIDGQKKPHSEEIWLQKFVPRLPRGLWSKINREKALALIASGEMQPAGLAAIENAKQSGRWDAAYDSPSSAEVPDDLAVALNNHPKANEFFENLDRANRYAILWRIQNVKRAETRARKIEEFIHMLERKERIHPTAGSRQSRKNPTRLS